MQRAVTGLPFDDIRRLVDDLPGPDEARGGRGARARRDAHQAGRAASGGWRRSPRGSRPGRGSERPAVDAAAGRRLRRQSRHRRARRLRLSAGGHAADGGELRRRRRGHQPDLQRLRPRPEGLRARARPADARHRRRRTPSTKSPARRRSPTAWRRSRAASTSSASARWGSPTRPSRRRSSMRSTAARPRTGSGAAPASTMPGLRAQGGRGRRGRRAARRASAIRSKCCAGSAGARSPRWSGAILAARMRARAGHRRRLRHDRRRRDPACACGRTRSTIASSRTARRRRRTARVLERLGKTPLLDLGMRLGEGTGAALAAGIVKAALAAHNGMATFAEAGVAGKRLARPPQRTPGFARAPSARAAASRA